MTDTVRKGIPEAARFEEEAAETRRRTAGQGDLHMCAVREAVHPHLRWRGTRHQQRVGRDCCTNDHLSITPGLAADPLQCVHTIVGFISVLCEPALGLVPPSAVLSRAQDRQTKALPIFEYRDGRV